MFTTILYAVFGLSSYYSLAENQIGCGDPPEIEKTSIDRQPSYPVESVVEYTCDFGYIPSGYPRKAVCEYKNRTNTAEWSEPGFHCVPRSCGDPGYVNNARRNGSVFTFGSKVEYICEEGFVLEGGFQRFCQTTGKWSGTLPSCRKIQCETPTHPENGRAIYESLDYGEQVQYECNKGLQLQLDGERVCSKNGQWSGNEPKCVAIFCELPKPPLHGNVDLVLGKTTVGSIVIYSCDAGYTLHGSKTAKCLSTKDWTYPTPQCSESCRVFEIENGAIGIYERKRGRQTFKELPLVSAIEGQEVYLRCSKYYEPAGKQQVELKLSCSKGLWSDDPVCKPAACRRSPPSVPNADLITEEREHGTDLTYYCKRGFVKAKYGSVSCVFGVWTGNVPICRDTHCYQKDLKFIGLKQSGEDKYTPGSDFVPQCIEGYELSSPSDPKLTCNDANWVGFLPPCKPGRCLGPPPTPEHGSILSYTGDHGSTAAVACDQGYQLTANPKCSYGKWENWQDICKDTHCYFRDFRQHEGVDMTNMAPINNKAYGNIVCLEGYELRSGQPLCSNGNWMMDHSSSPCQPNNCIVYNLHHGEFERATVTWEYKWRKPGYDAVTSYVKETIDSVHSHGKELYVWCKNPYTFQGKNKIRAKVTCTRGKWNPRPICLRRGERIPEETIRRPTAVPQRRTSVQAFSSNNRVRVTPVQVSTSVPGINPADFQPTASSISPAHSSTQHQEVLVSSKDEKTDANSVFQNGSSDIDNSDCSCLYDYSNPHVIAHAGMELLQIGSRVKEGCNVIFACQTVGYYRFVGVSEVRCENCTWSNMEFPTCEKPGQNDAVISIYSANNSLLPISPSGDITVPYGMALEITCILLESKDWPIFVNLPLSFDVRHRSVRKENDAYELYADVIIQSANSSCSGKYECVSIQGYSNHITLQIEDPVCPEIVSDTLSITYNNHGKVHSQARFGCLNDGAKLRGFAEVTCLVTGLWSGDVPVCEYSVCPEIVSDTLVTTYNNGGKVHSQARFHCLNNKAKLRGLTEVTCLATGLWSGDIPKCEYRMCPLLNVSSEMRVLYSEERKTNSQALFECRMPYVVDGSKVITCLDNEQWSDKVPTCKLASCTMKSLMAQLPENVIPFEEDVTGHVVPYGMGLRLACGGPNLVAVGIRNATCSKSGTWIIEDISCVLGCKPVLPIGESVLLIEPKKNVYRFGDFVTFSCPPGYKLSSPMVKMLCFTEGWTAEDEDIPTCISI